MLRTRCKTSLYAAVSRTPSLPILSNIDRACPYFPTSNAPCTIVVHTTEFLGIPSKLICSNKIFARLHSPFSQALLIIRLY